MKTLTQIIKEQLALAATCDQDHVELTLATQPQFGHYQCNSAMKWAKELKRSPREIAQQVVDKLDKSLFEKVEVAGPGFINLTLKESFLSDQLNRMAKDPQLGVEQPERPAKIIVDFSSPNIAKEMHVGHLRSTIIGECLARLFESLGYQVLRLNHVGDWGTAFGMLIAWMQQQDNPSPQDLATLMNWYRAAKKCFDEDESFKHAAREAVVALQQGNPQARAIWQMICQISRQAFEQVYDLLDVSLVERGESYYNPWLKDVVEDLEKKGLLTLSEGAKCVFHEGYEIPYMVQKSDGGYNYDTTDLAALRHRVEVEKADRIIVVTDAGQSLHFELLKLTAQKAGYLNHVRFDHVPFGVVLGADGKKFRTRSGEVEKLIDLLCAAQQKAEEILAQREHNMSADEVKQLAHILGIDAVKYSDLASHRTSDYTFSYDRMLRFEGNTASFILYAYVRIAGIRRRITTQISLEPIVLEHPSEIDLGLHLLRFHETLLTMADTLLPHLLTEYLYLLAQKFNAFFRDCRVEGSEEQNRRLTLCEVTKDVMAKGLYILGLKTVERM
ncbi:MAG: arginine--tRNA ligase [Verrucomicrobia bacterium]|nr:arginine--tRNA ligase [Verrucomicrobiota bacterium]MBS0646553.1 arginine--tRNA ligase [Verrucomicrobiota bacterium]